MYYVMADSLLPVERTISGKGVIKIPDDFRKAKRITLFTQVLRAVQTPSINLSFNPDKSFYAHITFCKDDLVLQTFDVNFESQMYAVWENQVGQNLLAIKCLSAAIFAFAPENDPLTIFNYNTFIADTLKFECFATTSLKLTLEGEEMQACNPEENTPTPTPPIPPPVTKVPPEDPLQVSPPYEEDSEDTDPVPQDEFEPPNSGCLPTALTYKIISAQFPAPGFTASTPFEGTDAEVLLEIGATPQQRNVIVLGNKTIDGQCVPNQRYPIFDNLEEPLDFTIVSIVPI